MGGLDLAMVLLLALAIRALGLAILSEPLLRRAGTAPTLAWTVIDGYQDQLEHKSAAANARSSSGKAYFDRLGGPLLLRARAGRGRSSGSCQTSSTAREGIGAGGRSLAALTGCESRGERGCDPQR